MREGSSLDNGDLVITCRVILRVRSLYFPYIYPLYLFFFSGFNPRDNNSAEGPPARLVPAWDFVSRDGSLWNPAIRINCLLSRLLDVIPSPLPSVTAAVVAVIINGRPEMSGIGARRELGGIAERRDDARDYAENRRSPAFHPTVHRGRQPSRPGRQFRLFSLR